MSNHIDAISRNRKIAPFPPCNSQVPVSMLRRARKEFGLLARRSLFPLCCAIGLLLAISLPATLSAQTAGQIAGHVADATGAAIPNAAITLTNVGTTAQRATVTTGSGDYTFTEVPPGTYTATLTVNGHSESQKIQVLADPRSHATPAEFQAEYAFASAQLSQMSQLDVVLNRLDAMRAQANALEQVVKGGANAAAFAAARAKLDVAMDSVLAGITSNPQAIESTIRYPDEIREHLQISLGGIEGGDQAPTPAQADQKTLLDPEFRAAMTQFDVFTNNGLRKFNAAMANLGLTGLATGLVIVP